MGLRLLGGVRSRRCTPGTAPGDQPSLAFFHGQPFTVELLKKGFFAGRQVETFARQRCAHTGAVAAYIGDFRVAQAVWSGHPKSSAKSAL
jgi:hypothetical protein